MLNVNAITVKTVKTDDSLAVMEEIIKVGNYSPSGHNASSVVSGEGLAPTVMENHGTVTAVMEVINNNGCIQVGNIYPDSENMANRPGGRVYSTTGCAPTILSRDFKQPKMIMEEAKIAAMRGRNPDNPSERGKSNGNYQQRLEVNENGTSNTITSVQKDNLVVEPLNPYKDGTCRTIKAQYQQSSRAKFARQDGLGATGVVQIGNIVDDTNIGFKNPQRGRVYSSAGLSPCLNCCEGGGLEPKVVEDWQTVVGNKQLNPFRGSVEGTSPCITSACGAGGGMTPMLTDADLETTKTKEFIEQVRGHETMRYRIRKLTPRECFRLMDVDDADIDKIQAAGISNSQQYKLAGNSIVVNVLYHLFRKMFVETENESQQLTLF